MRRLLPALLTGALVPGLVVLPSLPAASADPVPVQPVVTSLRPAGVDAKAMADLPPAERASAQGVRHGSRTAVLTPARATASFDVVGVTWEPGPTRVSVQVRVRQDGAWSSWEQLGTVDEGPDADTTEYRQARRTGTAPLLTAGADGLQLRVDTASGERPPDLRVDLIDGGRSEADDLAAQAGRAPASADATTAPSIVSRRQWGADESLTDGPHTVNQTVKAMILHHTAGSNTYTREGAFAEIRGIYAYHTRSLGWDDIGYNLLVDRYGRTFEGRRGSITHAVRGAHSGGFNTDTYGIAVMGDFQAAAVPQAAVDAVERAAGWKLGQYGADPRGTALLVSKGGGTSRYPEGTAVRVDVISGHRDVGQTACPGANLYAKLDVIRSTAAALAPGTPRIGWPAFPRDWTSDRAADVLAADRDGRLWSYPGTGFGGFVARRQIGTGWGGLDLVTRTGDISGDRRPDVVARHRDGSLYLFEGDGKGGFAASRRLGPGWEGFRAILGAGDWNSDGTNDLLAVAGDGALLLYAGNGRSGFAASRQIGWGWQNLSLLTAVGDVDSGGTADVVGRTADGSLRLYSADGSGEIARSREIGTGWGAMAQLMGPGDWNGDRQHDLLAVSSTGRLYLYAGNGLGGLARARQIGTGWGGLRLIG